MLLRSTFLVMTLPIGVLYVIIDFLNISGRGVTLGASVNYVDKKGGGRMSLKCQRYYDISLFRKLVNEGGGRPKSSKFCQRCLWMTIAPLGKLGWKIFLEWLFINFIRKCAITDMHFGTFRVLNENSGIFWKHILYYGYYRFERHTGRKWVCRMRLDCEAK